MSVKKIETFLADHELGIKDERLREKHNFGYDDNACVPVQLLSRMESLKSLSPKA